MTITNTLINNINDVRISGESYKNRNILKDRKNEIENFLVPFSDVCQQFETMQRNYYSIKKTCKVEINLSTIRTLIIQLQSKVKVNDYTKYQVRTLKIEIENINNDLIRSWGNYISEKTSPIDTVIETLGTLISDLEEKKQMQYKKYAYMKALPGSQEAINAIDDYVKLYESLMNKLQLKESVLIFIKLLTSQKPVTLSDMSDEVYDWIKTSGFAGKINIVMG